MAVVLLFGLLPPSTDDAAVKFRPENTPPVGDDGGVGGDSALGLSDRRTPVLNIVQASPQRPTRTFESSLCPPWADEQVVKMVPLPPTQWKRVMPPRELGARWETVGRHRYLVKGLLCY